MFHIHFNLHTVTWLHYIIIALFPVRNLIFSDVTTKIRAVLQGPVTGLDAKVSDLSTSRPRTEDLLQSWHTSDCPQHLHHLSEFFLFIITLSFTARLQPDPGLQSLCCICVHYSSFRCHQLM